MIRASKLDRLIRLQRETKTVDEFGTVRTVWTTFVETRAELVSSSLGENLKPFGDAESAAVVFRLRHVDGISTADRLHWNGIGFNIREVQELGRRRGLEIRCEVAT